MADKKYTYADALALAEKEPEKALPQYENYALFCRKNISDVLWYQVDNLKSALQFMRDFSLCCDDRTIRDKRVKDKPWSEIHETFFTILNVNPKNSEGKEWSLKTIKSACDMIHGDSLKDFLEALDVTSNKDKSFSQVHEFLGALDSAFLEQGYIKKAS